MIKFLIIFVFMGMGCSILILLTLLNKYRKRDHVKEDEIVKEIYSAVADLSGYYIDRNIKLYMGLNKSMLKNVVIDSTLNNILHDLHTIENFKLGLVEYDEVECIIKNKVDQMIDNMVDDEESNTAFDDEVIATDSTWTYKKLCETMYGNNDDNKHYF